MKIYLKVFTIVKTRRKFYMLSDKLYNFNDDHNLKGRGWGKIVCNQVAMIYKLRSYQNLSLKSAKPFHFIFK